MMKPEAFENDAYRIEYHTPEPQSPCFEYRVFDKKTESKSQLKIEVNEECFNHDGECHLSFVEEGSAPVYMSAFRPSPMRRSGNDIFFEDGAAEAAKYKNEPRIGGHREYDKENGSWHYTKNLEDVMSVYRALKNGDFKIARGSLYTAEYATKKVLKFMDSYIFNSENAKELLQEYMHKYPLSKKSDKQAPAQQQKTGFLKKIGNKLSR